MTYTVPAGATSLVVELWSDNTVGTAYIDDIQIRRVSEASLIMNLGVEKLTATSASMNQATIDKLWTDVVHSRRITTDMLVVGRGVNAIVDEFFDAADLKAIRDTEAGGWGNWGRNGTTNLNWYGATLTPGTARTFYYDVDAVAGYDKNSFLPVETGQVWRFVASYQSVVSGPRLGVRFIRKDNTTGTYTGSLIKALDGTSNVYAPAGNGVTVARTVEIPSDWSHISPFIQFDSTCTSAYVYGGATFTNMATSSLVVDGAITARNLTVDDTMWVNIIKFKKIGGGEIDANNIVADTGTIGILRGGILINDAVTTGILKADAITSKHTITGAAFQTTATTLRGVKIDATNGLRQWDSNGNLLFNIGGAAGPNLMVGDLMTSRLNTPGVRLVNSSYWGLPAIVYSYAGGNGVAEASTFMRYSVNNDPEMVHRAPDRSLVGGTGPGFVRIEGDLVLSLGLNSNQNMRSEQPFVLSAWSPADGYHSMTLTSKLCNINTTGGNIQLLSGSFYTQAPGIYNKTTGNAANMWITTDGGMFRSTSASKYKIDPQEMELAPTLLDVPVKNWIDKAAAEEFSDFFAKPQPWTESDSKRFDAISLKRIPGVIAEDVRDAGGEDFVVYGEDGEIEGLMYDRLAVAQIQLLKEMVESLTKRVAELETYTSR